MLQSLYREKHKKVVVQRHIDENNKKVKKYKDIIADDTFRGYRYYINQQLVNALLCQKILNEILKSDRAIEKYCREIGISADAFYRVLKGKTSVFPKGDLNKLIIKFIH